MLESNGSKKDALPKFDKPMVEIRTYVTKEQAEHLDKILPPMRLPESIEPIFETQLRNIAKSVIELNLSEDIEFQSLSSYDQKVFIINLVVGYFEGWKVSYVYEGLDIPDSIDFVESWYPDYYTLMFFANKTYLNLSVETDFNLELKYVLKAVNKIIGAEFIIIVWLVIR